MKKPLFEVGETVLIYSRTMPHIQGFETTIIGRNFYGVTRNFVTGGYINPNWGYFVSPDPNPAQNGIPWGESCLRKKHKPGQSFESLMQELKGPVKA